MTVVRRTKETAGDHLGVHDSTVKFLYIKTFRRTRGYLDIVDIGFYRHTARQGIGLVPPFYSEKNICRCMQIDRHIHVGLY